MDQSLLDRVECLERRNKILFGLLILLAAAFGIMLCQEFESAPVLKPPGKFVADSIEVNKLVAHSIEVTGFDDYAGELVFDSGNGTYGKNSVVLEATRDGWADISFNDLNGNQKAILILTPSGKPTLSFFDPNNAERLRLGLGDTSNLEDEELTLQLFDVNHKVIWQPNVKNPY